MPVHGHFSPQAFRPVLQHGSDAPSTIFSTFFAFPVTPFQGRPGYRVR
jgi:hypothetical protein